MVRLILLVLLISFPCYANKSEARKHLLKGLSKTPQGNQVLKQINRKINNKVLTAASMLYNKEVYLKYSINYIETKIYHNFRLNDSGIYVNINITFP
jgi:hypothetical protein